MGLKKYPREPLAQVRARGVDDAASDLAARTHARAEAERGEGAARAERERLARELQAVRDAERAALDRGELRAEDLARDAAWSLRARQDQASAERRVERAGAAVSAARATEERAREIVAVKRAEANVVDRDRAGWEAREQKKVDAREEEDAADAWRRRT